MSFSSSLNWTTDASFASGRYQSAADYVNGRLYVIDGSGPTATSSIFIYDSTTKTWQTDTTIDLVARFDVASAVDASGNIYIIDGSNGSSALAEVTKFDPATNTVVQVASTGTARLGAAAATGADGKIYLFGGAGNSDEVYNPTTNSWSSIAALPAALPALSFESAVADGSTIYVIGGTTTGDASGASNKVYAYDTLTNTWSAPLASLPTAVFGATAGLVDGMIVVAGGVNSSDVDVATTQIYDPTSNTWTTGPSMTTAEGLSGQGMVSSGSQLFVAGGLTDGATPSAIVQSAAVTPATSQLFFRINQGNDVQLGDINSNGTGLNTIYYGGGDTSGKPQNIGVFSGNETSVAVDTAAGLVFSVGIDSPSGAYDSFSVHDLNTGALIETVSLGDGDNTVQALALNPFTHTLYVGDWGDTADSTGVAVFNYDPSTGLVTASSSGHGSTDVTTDINNNPTTTTDNNIYVFSGTQISSYVNANAYFLDTTNNKLYYVDDDSGYDFSPFSSVNGVYVVDLSNPTSATELTSNGSGTGQFPLADQNGAGTFIGAHGDIVGLAVDVADGVVFFETTDDSGSPNIDLWQVSTTGGAGQTATKVTLPPGVTLSFAGQTNDGGDAAGLTFDQETGQLYLTNAANSINTPDTGAIYVLQWNNTTKSFSFVTSYDTATLVGTSASNVSPEDAPSTTSIDDLPVLTLGSATTTEPVQGSSSKTTLLTSPTAITDNDGNHLASATITITSGIFSGDELFVNGQQNGTLDSGAITVTWNNTNKVLTLTGYDTLTEYATLFGEVSFQETGNDTANTGTHTVRTITWQANDGAVGDPSGTNTATTTVTIDRPPASATHTINILEGATSGPASLGDTDPDGDTVTVTAITGGTVGSPVSGNLGTLTINNNDTYSYTANSNISAPIGSHPVDTFTYTASDANGGSTQETLKFSVDRPPVAVADSYSVNENGSDSGTSGTAGTGVLHNDSDPDGDTFTVVDVNGLPGDVNNSVAGIYGELTLNSDGSFTYTADQTGAINGATPGLPPTDTFNYTIADTLGGTSTAANITFTVHRPPSVTTLDHTVTYGAGGNPIVIDDAVQVSDLDGSNLESATIKISNVQTGDVLGIVAGDLINGNQIQGTNITESYDGNGTLTLTGLDNAADYQIALDEVTFSNSLPSPSLTPRTIDFSATGDTGAQSDTGTDTVDVAQGPLVTALTLNGLVEGTSTGTVTVANFTDVTLQNPTTANFSATIDWGDGTPDTTGTIVGPDGGPFSVQGSHTYAEEGNDTITVKVTDNNNLSGTGSDTENIADAPLTPGTVTVIGGVEGVTAAALSATFTDGNTGAPASDFSGTIDWGDTTSTPFTSADVTTNGSGAFTVSGLSHLYSEDGSYNVTVAINDAGSQSTIESGTTLIADAPLTAGNVTVTGGVEGVAAAALSASFTDANTGAQASDFSGTINWGDTTSTPFTSANVTANGNGSFTVSGINHLYAEDGSYNVSVAINDIGSQSTTDTGTATVADAQLTATDLPVIGTEGTALNLVAVANFTDANPNGSVGDFSATIDWGDGTTGTGTVVATLNGFQVEGSHLYTDEGTFSISTSIADTGGSTANTISAATIGEGDVLTGQSLVMTPNAGKASVTAVFSDIDTVTDVGDFSATINWGDGTPATAGTVSGGNGTFTVTGLHSYAAPTPATVTVTLVDDPPGTATGSFTLLVPATPVVTAVSSTVSASASETFTPAQLFSATEAEGFPILSYEVEDETVGGNDGFWVLNGAVLPNGQITTLTAAQLSQLSFVAGSASTPLTDTLEVAASDSAGFGPFTSFTVTSGAHASTSAPTVTAANEQKAPDLTLAASSLFSATAFGGNSVVSYEVEDITANSGHWVFNGVVEPANQLVLVTAAQLSQLSFATGYGSDTLMVRANDGSQWGSFTSFTVTPPPNAAPPAGTKDTLVMLRNADGAYEFYDIGHNTILLDGPLGQINPALQVAGVGGFNGSDTADLLMRDPATGAFTLYDVSNNNITGNVPLGQVGPEWTVAGVGDFSTRFGETDMLMRNSNSGAFEVYDISNNAITFSGPMGQVGLEWTVAGFGDFSGRANETDMLMRNSNTGAFEVYDISNNTITSAQPMGQVGLEWQIAGFGDFSTRPGETDMLLRNGNSGAFEVYDIVDNTITSAQPMGQVGLEWTIAGFGNFSGNANETDMLMRNSNSGVFTLYDIGNNTVTGTAPMGQVGLEWSISGVSASVAGAPPNSAAAQLTQAMASFAPSPGASAAASPLDQQMGPAPISTTLLTTNHA